MIIRSPEDCPKLRAKVEDEENNQYDVFALYNITKPASPHGQCCKASFPKAKVNSRLLKIYFEKKVENDSSLPSVKGFQLFITSNAKGHYSKLNSFNTNGIYMKTYAKESGYKVYKIKINQEINLEEDPKSHCKNFEDRNGYEKVYKTSHSPNMSKACLEHV